MANPASVGTVPAVLVAGTTVDSVSLHAGRSYSIGHNGYDNTGNVDANTIYLGVNGEPTASWAEGEDKLPVQDQRSVVVGPGVSTLYFKTAAGSPTFTIVPHRPLPAAPEARF